MTHTQQLEFISSIIESANAIRQRIEALNTYNPEATDKATGAIGIGLALRAADNALGKLRDAVIEIELPTL
ncbi:MAG: hypothetical protein ACOYD4_04175 [Solirubrobacterales bacterium]